MIEWRHEAQAPGRHSFCGGRAWGSWQLRPKAFGRANGIHAYGFGADGYTELTNVRRAGHCDGAPLSHRCAFGNATADSHFNC